MTDKKVLASKSDEHFETNEEVESYFEELKENIDDVVIDFDKYGDFLRSTGMSFEEIMAEMRQIRKELYKEWFGDK